MSDPQATRVKEAMHATVGTGPAPFILSACIGHDGTVWAVLSDVNGTVLGRTRPIGGKS